MIDKCWLIVNMDNLVDRPCGRGCWGHTIPERDRPSCIHHDKDTAERELLRLRSQRRQGLFVLFEAVAYAREQDTNPDIIEVNTIS